MQKQLLQCCRESDAYMSKYVIGIDQSTQGTKALLFDAHGKLMARQDLPHRQYIDENGYVSHDLEEIYRNVLRVTRNLVTDAGILPEEISCIGISNQRETVGAWERGSGKPLDKAIVWQCARAQEQCERVRAAGGEEKVREITGLQLSPYFCAAKIAWFLEKVPEIGKRAKEGTVCFGTIDSYLLYRLTEGKSFATDYSNASRTQLFDIGELRWSPDICEMFGIPADCLPEVKDSDSCFGQTDMEGFFPVPVPIHAMLGDSHGALFGQGCVNAGMLKATYGTGSSIMLNTGTDRYRSRHGLVTSLAWGRGGSVEYVLEGNINYTGAVISWLQNDMGLLQNAAESEQLAVSANPADRCYLVPAFSGLGAPHWQSDAKASIRNMSRFTGKAEVVRAGLDCIVYQINDVLEAMRADTGLEIGQIRVDGGPTRNRYLMRFQSDISGAEVMVSNAEELSGIGAAYMAGLAAGIYQEEELRSQISYQAYSCSMKEDERTERLSGWKKAVQDTIREVL